MGTDDDKVARFRKWAAEALPPELWQWAEMDVNTFAAISIMYAEAALADAQRDSERLEWLDGNNVASWIAKQPWNVMAIGYVVTSIREAIDQAMKEAKPDGLAKEEL